MEANGRVFPDGSMPNESCHTCADSSAIVPDRHLPDHLCFALREPPNCVTLIVGCSRWSALGSALRGRHRTGHRSPGVNVTELRLVGAAHPTADQSFRRFAKVDFLLCQCHSTVIALSGSRRSICQLEVKNIGHM